MSDALRVEEGARPWTPVAGITPGTVLDHFNVPRAGLLHFNGQTFFFQCILGDGGPTGVWAYVHLSDDEMSDLLHSSGPDEFDRLAGTLLSDRWVTLAAVGDFQIVESAVFDAGQEGASGLVERLMAHWELRRGSQDDVRALATSGR